MILCILFAYVVIVPRIAGKLLNNDRYSEWMSIKKEPKSGIITIWHIVGFKPCTGSIGAWLEDCANKVASDKIGVFFEVEAYTAEEAEQMLSRGKQPDMVSFAHGTYPVSDLVKTEQEFLVDCTSATFEGEVVAVPFCASGYLIAYDPQNADVDALAERISMADTAELYKKGEIDACLTDARGVADLHRSELTGKGRYFEVIPYITEDDTELPALIQYLGICSSSDTWKIPYAEMLMYYITSRKPQSDLLSLGLIPTNDEVELRYDLPWQKELADIFEISMIRNCFGMNPA